MLPLGEAVESADGRAARVFVVVMLVVVMAHFALAGVRHLFLSDFVDFDAYYTAALVFREGGDPYERDELFLHANRNPCYSRAAKRAGTLHAHPGFEHVHPYIYPPLLGFLMIPLTLVSKSVARSLWLAGNVGLALVAVGLLVRTMALRTASVVALAVALALGFHALGETLDLGQVNVVVSALVFLAVHLFLRGRRSVSAAALGLSIAVKLQPAAFLLYFLVAGEVRYVLVSALFVLLFQLPALAVLGPQPFAVFLVDVAPKLSAGYATNVNQALSGFVLRLLAAFGLDAAGTVPRGLATLAGLAVLGASLWWLRRGDHRHNLCVFSVGVMVVAPVTWNAHLVLLLMPVVYVLRAWDAGTPVSPRLLPAFALAYVLLGVVDTEFYLNRRLTGAFAVFASVRLFGMVLLLACLHAMQGGLRTWGAAKGPPSPPTLGAVPGTPGRPSMTGSVHEL